MSYGFPVTGDDWFFYSCDHKTLSIRDQLSRAIQISIEHYQGTNGRLLGNFLVSLFLQKALREIVRCGIILVILLSVYRLSGNRGLPTYLMCFALLIAMPAKIVAQTYAWAAGFFNYVPSGMLVLLYFRYAEQRFCEGTPRRSVSWSILLLLLGFSTQLFMENITIGVCILSAALFVLDCVRKKRPDPALAAHLIGAVVGCAVMFLAPGYKNVGHEGYRELPSDYTCIVQVFEENFKKLSVSLTSENLLVIILLCLSGGSVCIRSMASSNRKRLIPKACMLYFTAFPLICYGVHFAGRYFFFFDFFLDIGLVAAVIFTAVFCISDPKARFVLLVSAGSFVVFMIPLFAVTPIGSRNAYFFKVLFILITMILFHQATNNWKEMQQIAPALVLASCLLLFGNLWIHYRNGSTEQIRVQITSEAMKREENVIVLPGYPYPSYIHAADAKDALSFFYYYDRPGDISFQFMSYKSWIEKQ